MKKAKEECYSESLCQEMQKQLEEMRKEREFLMKTHPNYRPKEEVK